MDEQVIRSLIKWPDVPVCHGWLAFDRRGIWRMRNEYAQAHNLPGDAIRHEGLIHFIQRNLAHNESGEWFFQNGPQRLREESYCTRIKQRRDTITLWEKRLV